MRFRVLSLVCAMAVPFGAAFSQAVPVDSGAAATPRHELTLRIDNDAFDFWMPPWNRPDDEYTSGVHVEYAGGDAPIWARRELRGRAACSIGARRCRSGRTAIGQDIYTPDVSIDSAHAAPGSRPSGGWLFASQSARALDEARADELTVTLGVTGAPSLARFTQQLAHRAAPAFNRPTDWTRQVGFEPGMIVRYEQRRRVAAVDLGPLGFDVVPRVALSAGNIVTNGEAGFDARFGWHPPHPWLPEHDRFSLTLSAGADGQAVAHDIFLDGNTFESSARVGHEPFVESGDVGLELRVGSVMLAYRVQSDSRAYARGPAWHPWASLIGGVSVDR